MSRAIIIFTILLFFLTTLIGFGAWVWLNASYLYVILAFLFLTTWMVFAMMTRKIEKDVFIKNYLLSIVLKLLAGGIFIAVILFTDKTSANSNAILFMIGYLLLTGLEVSFLFRIYNKG